MSLSRTKTEFISLHCQHLISFLWNNSLGISSAVSYLSVLSQCSLGDLKGETLNQYLSFMWALEKPWIYSRGPSLPWTQPCPSELHPDLGGRLGCKDYFPAAFLGPRKAPRCLAFRDCTIAVSMCTARNTPRWDLKLPFTHWRRSQWSRVLGLALLCDLQQITDFSVSVFFLKSGLTGVASFQSYF